MTTASIPQTPPEPDTRTYTGPLLPGTRLVLEIPDAAAPAGYRVELPGLDAFADLIAPRIVAYVRAQKKAREAALPAGEPHAAPPVPGTPLPAAPAHVPTPPLAAAVVEPPKKPADKAPRRPVEATAAPVCAGCGLPKTRKEGGRYFTCTPCHSQAVSAGHANGKNKKGTR